MDAVELKRRQAPLKERFRAEPDSAVTPLGAGASFADPGITCTVDTWAGPVRAGLHRATGGDGSDACSGDMLLEALLACAGVTLRSVATAMQLGLRSCSLTASASFDARGTLGLDPTVTVGIGGITVTADVACNGDEAALDRLARLTEKYCVVGQSLNQPVHFVIRRAE
jgi:uncharacterized OsmC-like protein